MKNKTVNAKTEQKSGMKISGDIKVEGYFRTSFKPLIITAALSAAVSTASFP